MTATLNRSGWSSGDLALYGAPFGLANHLLAPAPFSGTGLRAVTTPGSDRDS